MFPTTLNTNEVKNAAGAEVEFQRIVGPGNINGLVYSQIGELPAYPVRLVLNHQEIGSGTKRRRRSRVGFSSSVAGQIDTLTPAVCQAYAVLDCPIGNLNSNTLLLNTMANLVSLLASRGASTTILYDCTGVGAEALVQGSL